MKAYLFDCIICDDEHWPKEKSKQLAFLRIARNFPKYKGKIQIVTIETFEWMFNNEEIKESDYVLIG